MTKEEQNQKKESAALLLNAVNEIRMLRRKNELQSARLEMFDDIKRMLATYPLVQGMAYTPDLCDQITTHLEETNEE